MRTFKKIVIYLLAFVLLAILLGVGYFYVEFNTVKYEETFEPNPDFLQYYSTSYDDARQDFKLRSKELINQFPNGQLFSLPVPTESGKDITIDMLFLPATQDSSKLLIISSGVHGVEGYVGSAAQKLVMNQFITPELLEKTGVFLIHAVNPYGFKYTRRVTENNVDLNRNSDIDPKLYETQNLGYAEVYDLVNPKGKLDVNSLGNKFFFLKAIANIAQKGMPVLRQAVLQGQYQFAEGLYFGGKQPEPQIKMLMPVIKEVCEPYQTVFAIDLHTGYGQRGMLHLFPNPVEPDMKARMERLFEGYQIDWGDSDDFYTVTGDFVNYIGKINTGKTFIPMTFEYGTMDSQTTMGSLRSIHIMIKENQGQQYGYDSPDDSVAIKHDLLEMYYPASESWQSKIMHDTQLMLDEVIPRFVSQ